MEMNKIADLIIDKPMTAGDILELACNSNPQVLAQLFTSEPESTFTVQVGISVNLKNSEARAAMEARGVTYTPAPKVALPASANDEPAKG